MLDPNENNSPSTSFRSIPQLADLSTVTGFSETSDPEDVMVLMQNRSIR
jgi:hypothetical protein